MTKAKCPKCGYTLILPEGKSPQDYICPEDGLPLEHEEALAEAGAEEEGKPRKTRRRSA